MAERRNNKYKCLLVGLYLVSKEASRAGLGRLTTKAGMRNVESRITRFEKSGPEWLCKPLKLLALL